MHRISKRFDFSASHQLVGLPADHPCARLHGHNYAVTVTLANHAVDEVGMVLDYGLLDRIVGKLINKEYDHRHLNDVFKFNPTAENIAAYLFKRFKRKLNQLVQIEVKEGDKTSAVYYE